MNSKERFDFMSTNLSEVYKITAEEVVQNLINNLIEALYIPIKGERATKVDKDRLKHFEVDGDEPINWGDLKCNEVKKYADGTFHAIIDEASPQGCQTFCEYIQTYMNSYGWTVRVETEW